MAATAWSLPAEQRADTVARVRASLAGMTFFRGSPLPDADLESEAAKLEASAYETARVQGTTTTGNRPHAETLQAYINKLSQLVLERVAASGEVAQPATKTSPQPAGHLDLSGQREFLTAKGAENIKFSTKSFGDEAAAVAARAIERMGDSLTHADMADIIAGRPEDEALRALRTIAAALSKASLVELDLSDNALGEKGVRAAAAAFVDQASLERLAFRNVGFSVHASAALDELLVEPRTLRALSLYNNMTGDEGAEHLARVLSRAPELKELSLVSSRVGAEGGVAVLEALRPRAAALTHLDLHDNPITEEAVPAFVTLLRGAASLKVLNLNDTGLGDAGAAEIVRVLGEAQPPLEELRLSLNELAEESAEALVTVLPCLPRLRVLDLRENELENGGLQIIAKACFLGGGITALHNLEWLDVSANQATGAGAVVIAHAASRATGLAHLGLDENELSQAAIDKVKTILEMSGKLGVLGSLDENMEPDEDEEIDELADELTELTV